MNPPAANFCAECGARIKLAPPAPTALRHPLPIPVEQTPTSAATKLPRRFLRQLSASAISTTGDGITLGALPLLALTLTDDSRLIAGVAFVSFLPWLLFALPIGVIVDRHHRQRLMVLSNAVRTVVLIVLATLAATGFASIWLLYVCLFILGIGEVLFDSCAQAFLPSLVEPAQLPRANGMLAVAETVGARFLGQPIGAVLFAGAVGLPFGVDAVSFAVSAALIMSIRVDLPVAAPTGDQQASFGTQITEGVRRLWGHALLRDLAVLLGIVNFAGLLGISIFVQFAVETLHVAERWYGALLALMAFGAMIGGLVGDRIVGRLGRAQALTLSYVLIGLGSIGTGLSPNVAVVAIFSTVDAFAVTMWNIVTVSLRQRVIPNALFGRINSVFKWLGIGSMALGALVGGQLAHSFGYRMPFVTGGLIIVAAGAYAVTALSERRIRAGEQQPWPEEWR